MASALVEAGASAFARGSAGPGSDRMKPSEGIAPHGAPAGQVATTSRRRAVTALAAIAFVGYFVALHALIVTRAWPLLLGALVVAPWAVALGTTLLRVVRSPSRTRRGIALAGVSIAIAVLAWSGSHLDVARFAALLAVRTDDLLFTENLVFFSWLAVLFATSLVGDREALVTRMARTTRRGDMPPSVVRYTRGATLGWSAFFAMLVVVTSLLFFFTSRESWSLFVNLLLWPLIGIAFLVEYAIRITVLRDVSHGPLLAAVHAFRARARAPDREGER